MRILVDITHPAHVHFFKPILPRWRRSGYTVHVTSREKDITCDLLDAYRIEHRCLSRHRNRKLDLPRELLWRCMRLTAEVIRFKPDVLIAREGVFVSLVGFFTGIPAISFDDTDDAVLQRRLYFPFAWRVFTDAAYPIRIGPKHGKYNAVSCLTYLGSDRLLPDLTVLSRYGLDPGQRLIILRLVNWSASHDVGHAGVDRKRLGGLVDQLSKLGTVLMTAEDPSYAGTVTCPIDPEDLLQVMAHAQLYVGESATMATECAILGVPAIHISTRKLWYTQMLERRGLVTNVGCVEAGLEAAVRIMRDPLAQRQHQRRLEQYLDQADDLGSIVEKAVELIWHPQPSTATRGEHTIQ